MTELLLEATKHLYYELHFSTQSIMKWKSFAKKEEIWVMIELNDVMPPIFLYEMPELAEKETGEQNGFCQTCSHFYREFLLRAGMQVLARAQSRSQQCLQDFKNVRHSVIIVDWCLGPAWLPAPALSLSPGVCLPLCPPPSPQPSHNLTNWPGRPAEAELPPDICRTGEPGVSGDRVRWGIRQADRQRVSPDTREERREERLALTCAPNILPSSLVKKEGGPYVILT